MVPFFISGHKSPVLMLSVQGSHESDLIREKMSGVHWILSQTWFQITRETLNTFPHITDNNLWLLGFNTLEKETLYLVLNPEKLYSCPCSPAEMESPPF